MGDFFTELKRRKIWWIGGAYIVAAWIIIQVISLIEGPLSLPGWFDTGAIVLAIAGLPLALILAWAQESQADAPVLQQVAGTRPSFAVLPFNNLSDNRAYDHLGDGLAEDIITKLSQWPNSQVAARNSSFAYRGTSPDIRKVGQELNVTYVMEGSIRELNDTVRVTGQLIDTRTGEHIWAENYDYAATEITSAQDTLTSIMSTDFMSAVFFGNLAEYRDKPASELSARELSMVARGKAFYPFSATRALEAQELVLENAERFADDWAFQADVGFFCAWRAYLRPREHAKQVALVDKHFARAGELTTNATYSNRISHLASQSMRLIGRYEDALLYAENYEAGGLNLASLPVRALALFSLGRYEEANQSMIKMLEQLGQGHPNAGEIRLNHGMIQMGLGDYASAEKNFRQAIRPPVPAHVQRHLVVALWHQGKHDEARAAFKVYQSLDAAIPAATAMRTLQSSDSAYCEMYRDGMLGAEGRADQ